MLCMLTVDYFDILSIFVRVDVVGVYWHWVGNDTVVSYHHINLHSTLGPGDTVHHYSTVHTITHFLPQSPASYLALIWEQGDEKLFISLVSVSVDQAAVLHKPLLIKSLTITEEQSTICLSRLKNQQSQYCAHALVEASHKDCFWTQAKILWRFPDLFSVNISGGEQTAWHVTAYLDCDETHQCQCQHLQQI